LLVPASVKVFANDDELAAHAATFIVRVIAEAIRERGRAMLALCGGRTPRKTYTLLAEPVMRERIDWARTYIFIGDERFVPLDDRASNFAMLQRVLLTPVSAPHENTFPVPTELATAAAAADAYASTIQTIFGSREAGNSPRFDLMLLGLGEDGHTAALFPGAASLSVTDQWVVDGPAGTLPPPVDRITMTLPVINNAREVLFLVSGADKATMLHTVLEGRPRRDECPAAGVAPGNGALYWFVDQAAAGRLSRNHQ
jgi:6-phosphogluconolactonase